MKLFVVAALCLASGPAHAEAPKIAVLPLSAKRVSGEKVEILDELLVNRVAKAGTYQVISANDINAMLGLEKSKEALGCDNVTCAADIGGALGADLLLAGSVSSLGGELIVSLRLIDIRANNVRGRAEARVQDAEEHYRAAIDNAVNELFGGAGARQALEEKSSATGGTATGNHAATGDAPHVGYAVALSLLPGGGMFYLGEQGWGAVYASLWSVGLVVAVLFNPGVLGSMLWIGGDVLWFTGVVGCMIHSGMLASDRRAALLGPPAAPVAGARLLDMPRPALIVPVLTLSW